MLSAKDAQIIARASRNRTGLAWRQRRRRATAGQSVIVAIIVLFLLLFMGGVFIALIANNLRNTRRGVQVSAADKFAQGGIRYLDQQLMTSAEGADWRPVPDCPAGVLPCVNISTNDPDYRWLKPYDPTTGEGGYTRVTFGGPTSSQSNLGGRALVRVSYQPYRTDPNNGNFVEDTNGSFQVVNPNDADRTRRYMRLESIGRVGVIDQLDPTTFQNSEGLGLRRELVAYKALGLTENLRFITDKDHQRPTVALGAPTPVKDRPSNINGDAANNYLFGGYDVNGNKITTGTAIVVNRPIYSVYQGSIYSNTDLTFYGLNYLALDSRRGDSIAVSGNINLNGVTPTRAATAGTDPTKVYVTDINTATPVLGVAGLGTPNNPGNVLPSNSPGFNSLNGIVRDNPRGSETQDLAGADPTNNNLRAAVRIEPPLIDTVVGDNGITRYREITRNAPPMAAIYTAPNPIGIDRRYAGAYGWGSNLYIPNAVDLPSFATTVSNVVSQRAEWLNPSTSNNWRSDGLYEPPAVTITLTPRWFSMTESNTNTTARDRSYLRRPDNGNAVFSNSPSGPTTTSPTVYRYSYEQGGGLANEPTLGIDDTDGDVNTPPVTRKEKFAGYPANRVSAGYYEGEFVIFAEGNVRIKGVAGGLDPETRQAFVRHITVVSNGTVYIDGSLLRDNISPQMAGANSVLAAAKGKSSIALLAKNYIAVNTTQFLSPTTTAQFENDNFDGTGASDDSDESNSRKVIQLTSANSTIVDSAAYKLVLGPVNSFNGSGLPIVTNVFNAAAAVDMNQVPVYLNTGSDSSLSLLVRHKADGDDVSAINLGINRYYDTTSASPSIRPHLFTNWLSSGTSTDTGDVLRIGSGPNDQGQAPNNIYVDAAFTLNPNPGTTTDYFFPSNGFPYNNAMPTAATILPSFGIANSLDVMYSPSDSNVDYHMARLGVVPLDVRIEALMYAQEGSFFIIPGPWFNPNSNDSYSRYVQNDVKTGTPVNHRDEEQSPTAEKPNRTVDPKFPFYGEPLDIRITLFGSITENLPAEIADQGAWLAKWGWVPRYYGSTGLGTDPTYPAQGSAIRTYHYNSETAGGTNDGVGTGIQYIYDPRLSSPYDANGAPLRVNPNFAALPPAQQEPLPPMPRLPVAPGLLYYGERPVR